MNAPDCLVPGVMRVLRVMTHLNIGATLALFAWLAQTATRALGGW